MDSVLCVAVRYVEYTESKLDYNTTVHLCLQRQLLVLVRYSTKVPLNVKFQCSWSNNLDQLQDNSAKYVLMHTHTHAHTTHTCTLHTHAHYTHIHTHTTHVYTHTYTHTVNNTYIHTYYITYICTMHKFFF